MIKIKEHINDQTKKYNNYYQFSTPASQEDLTTESYRKIFNKADWDAAGLNQLNFLIQNGLQKDSVLLDVGCGPLRGGSKAIEFLDPFNYYGVDVNKRYLEIGVNNVLKNNNLLWKVTENNFLLNGDFDFDIFHKKFNMIVCFYVFSYLPIDMFETFLTKTAECIENKGKVLASFWIVEENYNTKDNNIIEIEYSGKKIVTHFDKCPYYTKKSVLQQISEKNNWSMKEIKEHNFKYKQSFFEFQRL